MTMIHVTINRRLKFTLQNMVSCSHISLSIRELYPGNKLFCNNIYECLNKCLGGLNVCVQTQDS